ncbi:uncharacterized protein FFC1_15621 [Fusarium fujikuroi]|nr:uncharacterized protein FFC1_15621 [Fusarium fujikuroi]
MERGQRAGTTENRNGATERLPISLRAAPTDECPCGRAKETVEHSQFRCVKWTTQRKEIFQSINEKRNNLSFHLGGNAASDGQEWKPDMDAVRATIRFAIATGRL